MPEITLSTPLLILSVIAGVCLAASAGFRVFVPMLLAAIAARAGVIPLNNGLDWLSSDTAVAMLSIACIVEVAGFYVPWIDHALDTIAVPGAVVAGSLLATSQIGISNPAIAWVIGILAGGGSAGLIQLGTMFTRGVSLVTTGGLANPIVATAETGMALVASLLAIFVPVLAVFVIVAGVVGLIAWRRRRGQNFQPRRVLA
jgi:hypothetical protein